MIRRAVSGDFALPESSGAQAGRVGGGESWLLISQIDHARLSRDLAEHWGAAPALPLLPRDELLWAIEHHDDGWRAWEARPDVDPATGEPRNFTEMPLGDALRIWSRSIDVAQVAGPLPAYVVAGHFAALAHRSAGFRQADPQWPDAERFIAKSEAGMLTALRAWTAQDPEHNTTARALRALEHLQFFDALSLWFCCDGGQSAEAIEIPGGATLRLQPQPAGPMVVEPWPFAVERLLLEVGAKLVPRVPYPDRAALAAAQSQKIELRWQLVRAWPIQ